MYPLIAVERLESDNYTSPSHQPSTSAVERKITLIDKVFSDQELDLFNNDIEDEKTGKNRDKQGLFYTSYRNANNNPPEENKLEFDEYVKSCGSKGIMPIMQYYKSKRGLAHEIEMKNARMGDQYAEVFAETLPFNQTKSSLNLSNNRLSQKGANAILNKLSKNIERLDVSHNPSVKDLNIDIIILDYKVRLKELNIEGNNVGDKFVIKICKAMQDRPLMESLNISDNLISNSGAYAIANLLENNCTIVALFLKWNNIQAKGAASICDSLQNNNSVKILELAFNPIGMGLKQDKHFEKLTELYGDDINIYSDSGANKLINKNECNVCQNFSDMFAANTSLIHCDFSHCGFSFYECKIMSRGLKENHTILGLHMVGNKMNVDSLGFLKYDDLIPSASHLAPRIDNTLQTGKLSESKLHLKTSSNCWICEGWTQVKFKFDPYSSNNPPEVDLVEEDKVFIHLSFDDYAPDIMQRGEWDVYYITRMVPPIDFNYYFTINGVPKYATDIEKEEVMEEVNLNIPYTNVSDNILRTKELVNKEYISKLECHPRPSRPNLVIYEPEEKVEPDWNIKDSVFWGYMIDTADIHHKCFEFDWSQCKIPKIIKDAKEQSEVKQYLKSIYKPIRETYKFYAGISACGIIPCIGQNAFNELINLTEIVDGKDIKSSDIDFEFIATKAGNKNINLNPERWLVRYQLMEIFVRIALHKFYKSQRDVSEDKKLTKSMAVKKLFEEHLLQHFRMHDNNKWRIEKLWTKDNDEVIKSYLKYIKRLFDIYSGKHTMPGKTKFTSMDEFISMITNTGILRTGSIGVSDIGSIFNISMMTQINELEYDRHMQMSFVEFIEAICRVADKIKEIPEIGSGTPSKRKSSFDTLAESANIESTPRNNATLKLPIDEVNTPVSSPNSLNLDDTKTKTKVRAMQVSQFRKVTDLKLSEKIANFLEILIYSSIDGNSKGAISS